MFIGGTDQRALHHLLAELIDNAMDEAIAGHASRIEVALHDDGAASVRDNGRASRSIRTRSTRTSRRWR